MTASRFTRKSLALLMGLMLLFTAVLPASAAPSDGVLGSDGGLDSDGTAVMAAPAASDGNAEAVSSGGSFEQTDLPLSSEGSTEDMDAPDGSKESLALTLNEDGDGVIAAQNANGYIDDGWRAPAVDESKRLPLLGETGSLPASFDLRAVSSGGSVHNYMTAVRNQGEYGTCWAHAALSSAESNLLMQGGGSHSFSVLQLVHYTYFRDENVAAMLGTGGDVVEHLNKNYDTLSGNTIYISRNVMQYGGNDATAISTLSAGLGPIPESALPYPPIATADGVWERSYAPSENVKTVIAGALPASQYAIDKTQPQFDYAYTVNLKSNPGLAKRLLMTSGAASVAYYTDDAYYNEAITPYAYYQNLTAGGNHAVTLCGWDDNYAVSNFKAGMQPRNPGAWLCKNSWGAEREKIGDYYYKLWGDGYFWISYEDTSLQNAFFYGMKSPEDGYDYLYQHDGGNYSYWINRAYDANVFTAAQESEQLEAVRVALNSANNTVTIMAYSKLANSSNPTSGVMIASATHNCPYAGTYTLPFDRSAVLPPGEDFSIVVHVQAAAPYFLFDFPYNSKLDGARSSRPAYSGKSFVSTNGRSWSSLSFTLTSMSGATGNFATETATVDLRIKALTSEPDYEATGVYGDVNASGKLDLGDAIMTARCAVGYLNLVQSEDAHLDQFGVADVFPENAPESEAYAIYGACGDGFVTVGDVISLCRILAGS